LPLRRAQKALPTLLPKKHASRRAADNSKEEIMGAATSKDEDLESDSFSEVDGDDCGDEDLMPRNEELEEAILSEFVEALIDVAPPTWPPPS
jgi:hypothetical protein